METKICSNPNCKHNGQPQPLNNFHKNKSKKDGYNSHCKTCMREKYLKARDNILETRKIYRQKNKDKINANKKIYESKRLKEDPLFKIKRNIGRAITRALKLNKFDKNQRTLTILGCSLEEFKTHIETQFEPWMNWDNYGMYLKSSERTWNIDHIIPISSAKTENAIILLNNYKNLRPLCSKLNNNKSNKFIE